MRLSAHASRCVLLAGHRVRDVCAGRVSEAASTPHVACLSAVSPCLSPLSPISPISPCLPACLRLCSPHAALSAKQAAGRSSLVDADAPRQLDLLHARLSAYGVFSIAPAPVAPSLLLPEPNRLSSANPDPAHAQ